MKRINESVKDLLLCHAAADSKFVRALARDCVKAGITVRFEEAELLSGESLIEKIQKTVNISRFFAVVISSRVLNTAWAEKELEPALKTEITSDRQKLLPIILDPPEKLPRYLQSRFYVDFSKWPSDSDQYTASIQLLTSLVKQKLLRALEIGNQGVANKICIDPDDVTIYTPKQDTPSESSYIATFYVKGKKDALLNRYRFPGNTSFILGREKNADIRIRNDPYISRYHCRIETMGLDYEEKAYLGDLKSSNGTYVNGKLSPVGILKNYDIVQIGHVVFIVKDERFDVTYEDALSCMIRLYQMLGLF